MHDTVVGLFINRLSLAIRSDCLSTGVRTPPIPSNWPDCWYYSPSAFMQQVEVDSTYSFFGIGKFFAPSAFSIKTSIC